MSDRTYYVLCDDNCRFEGMTKEQIYDAIAEATGSTPTPVDEAFITMIKEQNAQSNLKVWKGTEAQYNALEAKDANTLYFVGTNKISDVSTEVQPISRGGTGATTASDARTNLGIGKTLLWTNETPDADFPLNKSITVDLSPYDEIAIVYKQGNYTETHRTLLVKSDGTIQRGEIQYFETYNNSSSEYGVNLYTRLYIVAGDKQTFRFGWGTNAKLTSAGLTTEADATAMIPLYLYGIKTN